VLIAECPTNFSLSIVVDEPRKDLEDVSVNARQTKVRRTLLAMLLVMDWVSPEVIWFQLGAGPKYRALLHESVQAKASLFDSH
jgi:hypothetical protein